MTEDLHIIVNGRMILAHFLFHTLTKSLDFTGSVWFVLSFSDLSKTQCHSYFTVTELLLLVRFLLKGGMFIVSLIERGYFYNNQYNNNPTGLKWKNQKDC